MADPRRPLGEEEQLPQERRPSELEREERRLERLRLIAAPWPTPNPVFDPEPQEAAKPPVREADPWKGSGGTGRFPQRPFAPGPQEAA